MFGINPTTKISFWAFLSFLTSFFPVRNIICCGWPCYTFHKSNRKMLNGLSLFYFLRIWSWRICWPLSKLDLLWGIGNQKIRFYDDSAVAVLHHHLPGPFINSYALIDWLIFSAKTVLKKTGWYFQQKTVKNLPKF